MTQQSTYTLRQLNDYGHAVNTITGLGESTADHLAEVLRTGDAYTGDRPWTCEIVRELTREEQLAAVAASWLGQTEQTYLASAAEVVACLRHAADKFEQLDEQLGGLPLGATTLAISLHVMGSEEPAVLMTRVDQLADAVGLVAHMPRPINGRRHYNADNHAMRVLTIVPETPEPVADPILDLIAQASSAAAGPVVHKHDSFWKGDEPGSCGASCTCGTTFDGFDTLGEASDLVDRHIERENAQTETVAVQAIAPERVTEILAKLNELTAGETNWWTWLDDLPEFDGQATAAAPTTEVHLVDGTVFRFSEASSWFTVSVAGPSGPVVDEHPVDYAAAAEAEQITRMVVPAEMS